MRAGDSVVWVELIERSVFVEIGNIIIAIGTVLLMAHLTGWVFKQIGQPHVVGEMVAGIALGPSLFGHFFPVAFAHVFPASSVAALDTLGQFGMLLFMFLVGLEADPRSILKHKAVVVVTSSFSILLPLVLGIILGNLLYTRFAGEHVPRFLFALFVGTAMSVTAFPVLAGILRERGLVSTNLGVIAISCAAINDVAAWLLLAVLSALVHSSNSLSHFTTTLLWLVAFVLFMFLPVRRAVAFVEQRSRENETGMGLLFVRLFIMLAASWTTSRMGIHPLFGAFTAGLVMHKDKRVMEETAAKIEPITVVLLVPVFFALTGLRTHIDLLAGNAAWHYVLPIIVVATIGKVAGTSLASRFMGFPWNHAMTLGVLLNTRGLVELVILNSGLELGIISSALFSMMVVMAVVTTFMTTPALRPFEGAAFVDAPECTIAAKIPRA